MGTIGVHLACWVHRQELPWLSEDGYGFEIPLLDPTRASRFGLPPALPFTIGTMMSIICQGLNPSGPSVIEMIGCSLFLLALERKIVNDKQGTHSKATSVSYLFHF
jgi:hypothetical protein